MSLVSTSMPCSIKHAEGWTVFSAFIGMEKEVARAKNGF